MYTVDPDTAEDACSFLMKPTLAVTLSELNTLNSSIQLARRQLRGLSVILTFEGRWCPGLCGGKHSTCRGKLPP